MTNEKSINSPKSQDLSNDGGGVPDASDSHGNGVSDQAMSGGSLDVDLENVTIDGAESGGENVPDSVASSAHESGDPFVALKAERDELKDQLLRALADTENMRRRNEREAANVRKYGHTPFARDLVGAIDNLARAVESAPDNLETLDETTKSLITGIQLSWTELQSVIEKHGIKRVEPHGEKFDYNLHQAMFEVPTLDQPSGVVLEVVQHGYVLHDRLLRPAMVGVSKAGEPAIDDNDQTENDS